ncbi:MAG: hypothetical protein HOL66_01560 [Rhodospirillaceae bacterium]|nr:hypothetical protein [Rhodospirillaceae bacterium]MBT5242912.1 hypothetical protein [Rhodospirillaceae bacterium]MBT5563136.1 hypothetical protein [Rhodospirillaceae bacterium]MBT6243451.1 hypothetical protein [Rhodospirillaceae bacterium]
MSDITATAPMRRIVLDRITNDFDPEHDLPLGPWNFLGAEDVYGGWENLPFVPTFDGSEKLIASDRCHLLIEHQILRLARILNERHGRQYGPLFWRIILTPWVITVVHQSWRTFIHARKFISRYGNEALSFPAYEKVVEWDFVDYEDFFYRGFSGLEFSAWFFSQVFQEMRPQAWKAINAPLSVPLPRKNAARVITSSGMVPVRRILRSHLDRLPFTNVIGVGFEKLLFSAFLKALPCRESPDKSILPRDSDPETYFPAGYLAILNWLLDVAMPRPLRQDFEKFEKEAAKQKFKKGRLQIGAPDAVNTKERFHVAMAAERGQKIIMSQHGGAYGTLRIIATAPHAEYPHHAFITWGWKRQEDHGCNALPLPSPFLSKLRDRHSSRDDSLILVGTRMTPGTPAIFSSPEPEEWLEYRRDKVAFVQALQSSARAALMYRPYSRADSALDDEPFMRGNVGDLNIQRGDLHEAMLGCRLLVLDHPMTTLHIAMAANVPTIGFWLDDAWPLCRQAEPIFGALRSAKILFDGPEPAAEHVNEVWGDVTKWWLDPFTRQARQDFCDQYALTSRTWWWDWLKAFYKV